MANNNNVQNVKFLRNGVVFGPRNGKTARQVALDAMELQKSNLADGTAILGRYQETNGIVKTLVGFAYISGDTKTLTVFDVDGAGADVDEKIKTAIEALDSNATSKDGKNVQVKVTEVDGKITAVNITTDNTVNSGDVANAIETEIGKLEYSDAAVAGQYVSQVSETDGKIAVVRVDLPSLTEVKETGKPIVAVSEDKGQVAARVGNINAEFVDIADSGNLITATTVEGALAEIAAEIDGMDLDVVSGDGEVITAVSEKDGKVSASKTAIKDVKLTGYVKNTTATGAISETDDIEDALNKLENKIGSNAITNGDGSITVTPTDGSTTDVKVHIKSGERVIKLDSNRGGIYTNLNLVKITDGLPATLKESYEFRDSDGARIGESIDIPKDSHIVSITYNESTQKLVYTYIDVKGKNQTTEIDLSHLILESEFASGVTSSNGVAHGVVSPTSEKDSSKNSFLTVGADGFKVDGIKGEIDTKINALDATVGSTNVESGKHVAVQVVEDAGKLTALTVTESDIASAQGLVDEIAARGNADTELSHRLGANVTTANTASAQLSALSGTSEDASGVTSVWGAKKYAQQYADEKVATVVDALDATVNGQTADGKVKVQVVQENGVLTAVTVTGTDIASDSALAAEIAARKDVDGQTGQTYAANTSSSYINNAISLNDADVKLAAALKAADDAMLTGVTAGNGITVSDKEGKSQTISAKVNNDGGIVNDGTGLHLGTIDCGIY